MDNDIYPSLDQIIADMGYCGLRLAEMGAAEGAAGNMSVFTGWEVDPTSLFRQVETISLPVSVQGLAGNGFLVTGSGRRLRDIASDPDANLGYLRIKRGGEQGTLFTSPKRQFTRLTSELNTHLAVQADQVATCGVKFHAVIHAQPPYLTYLSHIVRYQDEKYLNRHLLRWEPETIVVFPEGVGSLPYCLPGSEQLMEMTVASMRKHRVVVWGKHGVLACGEESLKQALDRIDYIEAAARYEYMNLASGEEAEGLSAEQVREIARHFAVEQEIF